jgi:biotin operon repressor
MPLTSRAIGDALGVSHQVVSKAIKKGRIDPSKPIEQIRIDWERNADPLQRARGLAAVAAPPAPPAQVQPIRRPAPAPAARRVVEDDADGGGPAKLGGLTKYDLEMRDMAVRLKLRQVALREKEGALIRADEVRAEWSALVLNAKSRLLQLGDELSDELACSSDRVHCKKLIDDKVYEILTELARYKPEE